MNNIIYAAVRFCDEEKAFLFKYANVDMPNVYGDHLTLAFGEKVNLFHVNNVGKLVSVHLKRVVKSSKLTCIQVSENIHMWGCTNLFPHITVCTSDGVCPVESNTVIKDLYEGDPEISVKDIDDVIYGHVDLFVKTPDGKAKWFLE